LLIAELHMPPLPVAVAAPDAAVVTKPVILSVLHVQAVAPVTAVPGTTVEPFSLVKVVQLIEGVGIIPVPPLETPCEAAVLVLLPIQLEGMAGPGAVVKAGAELLDPGLEDMVGRVSFVLPDPGAAEEAPLMPPVAADCPDPVPLAELHDQAVPLANVAVAALLPTTLLQDTPALVPVMIVVPFDPQLVSSTVPLLAKAVADVIVNVVADVIVLFVAVPGVSVQTAFCIPWPSI
jgi:hypothetical protein